MSFSLRGRSAGRAASGFCGAKPKAKPAPSRSVPGSRRLRARIASRLSLGLRARIASRLSLGLRARIASRLGLELHARSVLKLSLG